MFSGLGQWYGEGKVRGKEREREREVGRRERMGGRRKGGERVINFLKHSREGNVLETIRVGSSTLLCSGS